MDLTGLVLPERFDVAQSSEGGRRSVFVVEPLERGFGYTLGNSMRRVLLSSLRGSAVWAFRIDGVVHEHQTIQGVAEDVHQVIQNLKSLVVVVDADAEEVTLTIDTKNAGPVTAGDIVAPGTARVVDPGHHLFTLQEDRKVHVELFVNKGRGFVLADQHAVPKGAPVDLVRIDAIYNPVRRANFAVEETRVGQRTDFDRLTLDVVTDGSVDPADAVGNAAGLVSKHLGYLQQLGGGGTPMGRGGAPDGAVAVSDDLQGLFARTIEDLAELSVRSRNSLQKENIQTLGDLVQKTEDEMLAIENFGKKSLKEISDFLGEHRLHFGMSVEENEGRFFVVEDSDQD